MAKIIEITGPAGAGKTTILKSLFSSRDESCNCLFHKSLYPRQKINFLDLSSLVNNLPYFIKFRKTHLDNKVLTEAGTRFVKQNQPYINVLWENLVQNQKLDTGGVDNRFFKAALFWDLIQKYQYIKELNVGKYVMCDEGLIHFLPIYGSVENKNMEDDLTDLNGLLQVMPLPDAFIFIDTDVEIIAQRAQQRKKLAGVHKHKNEEEIRKVTEKVKETMGYVKDILASLGVPVLVLDSRHEVEKNRLLINNFVNNLQTSTQPQSAPAVNMV